MTTNLAYVLPAPGTIEDYAPATRPSRIRAVSPRAIRRPKPKLTYALVATGVIFAIFMAQLLLTISLSGGAYAIAHLQGTQRDLARQSSALSEKLDTLGSAQNLASNAKALGMVGSSSMAFLRSSDGKVIGTASPAKASTSTSHTPASANSVPNYLLTGVSVISANDSGHGAVNTGESQGTGTQSSSSTTNAGSSLGSSTGDSSQSGDSGQLPSPQTH
jgi:hypothetical protein